MKMSKKKILVAALALSLAGNVYLGGHCLGRWMSPRGDMQQEWRERDAELKAALSAEDYAAVKDFKREKRDDMMSDRKTLNAACARVEEVMRAEVFDARALDSALEAEKQAKAEMFSRMRATRDEMSKKMTPEGQATFERVMKKKPGMCKRRMGEMPPKDGEEKTQTR